MTDYKKFQELLLSFGIKKGNLEKEESGTRFYINKLDFDKNVPGHNVNKSIDVMNDHDCFSLAFDKTGKYLHFVVLKSKFIMKENGK